jgi:hypothetical protein
MGSEVFYETLNLAKQKGLTFDNRLERKCINGVWGIYAREDISSKVLIASYPVENLIPEKSKFPEKSSVSAKQIYSAAKEYCEKENSLYAYYFNLFDSIEYLKKYSTFFITEKELRIVSEVSPILLKEINYQNYLNNSLINALYEYDSTIPKDVYTFITLNYNSRAIGKDGFVPIIECFNHSNERGEFISTENNNVVLKTKIDYKKGDEVFISYGALDLYTHAINYNYYAPGTDHYMQFHKRFLFPILTMNDQLIAKELSQSYKVSINNVNGLKAFNVEDKDAYLTEKMPSSKLIEIVSKLSKNKNTNEYLIGYLKQALSQNKVSGFSEKYFPARIKRFYWVLLKEQEMLLNNIEHLSNL